MRSSETNAFTIEQLTNIFKTRVYLSKRYLKKDFILSEIELYQTIKKQRKPDCSLKKAQTELLIFYQEFKSDICIFFDSVNIPIPTIENTNLLHKKKKKNNRTNGKISSKPQFDEFIMPRNYKPKVTVKEFRIDKNNLKAFYQTWVWKDLRYQALEKYGRKCCSCGSTVESNAQTYLVVDHIKPIRFFPQLALDMNNLQVLCNDCNMGKGNWDETNYRLK